MLIQKSHICHSLLFCTQKKNVKYEYNVILQIPLIKPKNHKLIWCQKSAKFSSECVAFTVCVCLCYRSSRDLSFWDECSWLAFSVFPLSWSLPSPHLSCPISFSLLVSSSLPQWLWFPGRARPGEEQPVGFRRGGAGVWHLALHDWQGDVFCGGARQTVHGHVPQPVLWDV